MANSLHDWDYSQSPTYPQGALRVGSAAPLVRPTAVRRAVLLMQAGAILTVVQGVARGLTTNNVTSYTTSPASPHSATLHDSRSLVAGIIGGVIFAAFWLWMAWKNRAGRNWARMLSSVFFGLLCLQLVGGTVALARSALPAVDFIVILVLWGLGLAATIYLWLPESSMFYALAKQSTGAGGHDAAHLDAGHPDAGHPDARHPGKPYTGNQLPANRPPQHGYGVPRQYGHSQPSQYGHTRPSQPGHARPSQPGHARPSQPGLSDYEELSSPDDEI